jgi:8-oxo-dGTP pyrophosphatase MutT (NUDIX family)
MKGWKTVKSKEVYKCKYLKVFEEDFLVPSGKMHRYYILKRNDYVIVIAKEGNYLYLIEQYRYTTKTRLLQVVAGGIEKGETPLQAAKKELEEEAGIRAKKFKRLGWFYSYYGCSNQRAYVFLVENLEFGEQKPDELEKEGKMRVKRFSVSEVSRLIKSGKIRDVDTIASFGMFMLKHRNN